MNAYNPTPWQDDIYDQESGELIQEGTPMSRTQFYNMETGILGNNLLGAYLLQHVFQQQRSTVPLLLSADRADDYLEDASFGNAALEAIMTGRQILVRVPNADSGNYTANYSPVYMYQLPNYQNQYLYLFFIRDEKQDLSALGIDAQMPIYGQLKMLLSQQYDSDPLTSAAVM